MTLQALREKIGDFAFLDVLRTWATQNRHANVTTRQFITLAGKMSGQDLTQFFHVWIYQADKPAPGSW
jgi:aminopeptidase N